MLCMQLNHDVTMEPATIDMNFTERTVMGSEPELSSTITTRLTIFDQALQPTAMARAAPTVIPTSTQVSSAPVRRHKPTAYSKGTVIRNGPPWLGSDRVRR
ncbi:uncharacterized protein ACHE_21104S [Aspergillus chevalieri]|uniref:Uncharacterized protein n=1 Tax=Aspergillus chevalieri TaxID=182096 RepID=A0A7R7VJ54_ASPCH|nr:uncharacterized protein ACHE_21104S [Aspergillus chevalieri]BCR85646.1 hypothetical protein ACHE_21104S [Aspergillus chevalieri]